MYRDYKSDEIAKNVQAKVVAGRLRGKQVRRKERSWRDVLISVADMNLWPQKKREDREPWKGVLDKAEELLSTPRKPLPQVSAQTNI